MISNNIDKVSEKLQTEKKYYCEIDFGTNIFIVVQLCYHAMKHSQYSCKQKDNDWDILMHSRQNHKSVERVKVVGMA